MATLSVNGTRVSAATFTQGFYGTWACDLQLATDGAPLPTGPRETSLVIGNRTLAGTVVRQGNIATNNSARIVGGGGGLGKVLDPKGYSQVIGVSVSTVVTDAAAEASELVNVQMDSVLGTHWARLKGKLETLLYLLTDDDWWVDDTGTIQIGMTRDASPIVQPFSIVNAQAGRGQYTIATEEIAAWQPGRTFQTTNVPAPLTVSSVSIEMTNEGKLQLCVLTSDDARNGRERLRNDIKAIVRRELSSVLFMGTWEYTIAPSLGIPGISNAIDCSPTDDRMPPLTNVPIKCLGVVQAPIAGTVCRIRFLNGDPSRPECIGIEGVTEHMMTVEAFTVVMHNLLFALSALGLPAAWAASGVIPTALNLALSGAAAGGGAGLIAQTAAAASQAGSMPSGPGSSSTLYAAAIAAAMLAKLPDVTGMFPGIGVPNG